MKKTTRLLSTVLERATDGPIKLRFVAPDGTVLGDPGANTTIRFRNDDAVAHLVRSPGELGFGRAYVSGSLDIEGSIWDVVAMKQRLRPLSEQPLILAELAPIAGPLLLHRPPIPPEENQHHPLRPHTKRADAADIRHHYDVGNDFHRLFLGESMTYSCAVFGSETTSLDDAQCAKHELVCSKLGLQAGMRLLDIGCGWGSMVMHAATVHGVEAVGITLSEQQAALARERVAAAGLESKIDIRILDYRDLGDETFDAISSIGMLEHVGRANLPEYFTTVRDRLRPGGRVLNHQIARTALGSKPGRSPRTKVHSRGFVHRYVFPNGELHEVGDLIGTMQRFGLEARHMESLREHYAMTLRHWVENLEGSWDEAVELVGEGRARVWHLYMAASSHMFSSGELQIHQVLATHSAEDGTSSMPLRPTWS
jgi:cyclopropane-fatty-acyl-phospholipid synthase